jgi:uncharacterized small protein (DUF1192 family)
MSATPRLVIKDLKKETIQERVNDLCEEIDRLNGELHKKEADHRSTLKTLEDERYAHIK